MTDPSYQQQMQQRGMPPADLRDAPIDQPEGRPPANLQDGPVDQTVPPADRSDGRAEQSPYDDAAVHHPDMSDPAVSDPAVSDPAVSDADTTDPMMSDPAGSDHRSDKRLTTADLAGIADPADRGEPGAGGDSKRGLFPEDDANSLRDRWRDVQAGFVDEPRRAVQDADALVADLMQRLAETFANERTSLEGQWDRTGDVSTEEMRVALQRYRSFFDRLLSV